MYTEFGGVDFLYSYVENRNQAISYLKNKVRQSKYLVKNNLINCKTCDDLRLILTSLKKSEHAEVHAKLECYLKRFEVAKKLRTQYPVVDTDDIASIDTHLLFFYILVLAYSFNKDIRYLNALLKLSDSLVSQKKIIQCRKSMVVFIYLLKKEILIVKNLLVSMKVEL